MLRRLQDFRQVVAKRLRRRRVRERQFGESDDHAELVVEVVRHAAGQAADRFHLLGLAELFLEPPALRDVAHDRDGVRPVEMGERHADLDREDRAVLAPVEALEQDRLRSLRLLDAAVKRIEIEGQREVTDLHGEQFLARVAKFHARSLVDVQQPARLGIEDLDAVVGPIEQGSEESQLRDGVDGRLRLRHGITDGVTASRRRGNSTKLACPGAW